MYLAMTCYIKRLIYILKHGMHCYCLYVYNYGIMPIANIMKMRKMFYMYFYISMDSRVKIDCFLNNIVVIAQKILVLSQNSV